MTTEVQGEQKVWTSKTEMSKHISFAKQLGIDCGATDPKDPCDLDANECKISELCERATIGEDNKQWNLNNPDHVRLAKEYSLSCDVNDEKKIKKDNNCTYSQRQNCSDKELCQRASWANSKTGVRSWYSDGNVFVIEAKQRNLDCGVTVGKKIKKDNTCTYNQPQNCNEEELCKRAIRVNTETGVIKRGPENDVNVKEAKRRALDCGVVDQNTKSISCKQIENLKTCSAEELCQMATTTKNGSTVWANEYSVYRLWAKERGLTCGVNKIEPTTCTASTPEACETTQLCELATTKRSGVLTWASPNSSFKQEAVKRGLKCDVFLYDLKNYKRYNHEGKRAGEVSIGVIDRGWNGERFYSWPNGAALFLTDWKHDKSYNSNSNTNVVFPTLRSRFNKLPLSNRIQIQKNLKDKGMYTDASDGLWGRNTLVALVDYSSRKFFSINLNNSLLVDKVLSSSIFDKQYITRPAIAHELNQVHKSLSNLKEIDNKSFAFKSSFLNQSQLKRKQIQYALNKLGYYRSGIDGLWGNGTKNALTSFAAAEGLGTSTPSTIFSKLLSKVSVPSSFAAPKQNRNSNNKSNGNNKGWVALSSNPKLPFDDAREICEAKALAEGNSYLSANQPSDKFSSVNCYGYGSNSYSCRRSSGGGVAGGILRAWDEADNRNAAKKLAQAVAKACMADYGWIKK